MLVLFLFFYWFISSEIIIIICYTLIGYIKIFMGKFYFDNIKLLI